jgi:hypothetical protein
VDNVRANALLNIVLVSDQLNKREIGTRAPSEYISTFAQANPKLPETLRSHLIGDPAEFGILTDDYDLFLKRRAKLVLRELEAALRLEIPRPEVPKLLSAQLTPELVTPAVAAVPYHEDGPSSTLKTKDQVARPESQIEHSQEGPDSSSTSEDDQSADEKESGEPEESIWRPSRDLLLFEADVRKILASAKKLNSRDYIFLAIVANTGLRLGEVLHLRCNDLEGASLRIILLKRKNIEPMAVPIPQQLADAIRRHLGDRNTGYVFPGNAKACASLKKLKCTGGHAHARAIQRQWTTYLLRTGLDKVDRGIHYLRHFAILRKLSVSRDPYETKISVGHSSLGITERYIEILKDIPEGVLGNGDPLM